MPCTAASPRPRPGLVVVKRLDAPHPEESFTHYRPLSSAMVSAVGEAVRALFEELGGPALLKPSGDVYIKPNAVEARRTIPVTS